MMNVFQQLVLAAGGLYYLASGVTVVRDHESAIGVVLLLLGAAILTMAILGPFIIAD